MLLQIRRARVSLNHSLTRTSAHTHINYGIAVAKLAAARLFIVTDRNYLLALMQSLEYPAARLDTSEEETGKANKVKPAKSGA